jgi:hypothetical protein
MTLLGTCHHRARRCHIDSIKKCRRVHITTGIGLRITDTGATVTRVIL